MADESDTDGIIDQLLAKHRATGILLHRPYPPTGLPSIRSRLGGLPNLPDALEWPHGRSPDTGGKVPLHFVAQIDCAELPQIDARLPSEGMLFFFVREDEEQNWAYPDFRGDDSTHHDDCRVLYASHVPKDQPVRDTPANLPPIQAIPAGYELALPDRPGPSIHYRWPLLAMEFDTWPDGSAFNPRRGDGYDKRAEAGRLASFTAATGLAPVSGLAKYNTSAEWQQNIYPSTPFRRPPLVPIGAMIRALAYEIITEVASRRSDAATLEARELVNEAHQWLAQAEEVRPDQAMPAEQVRSFEAWLDVLSQLNESDRDPPPFTETQAHEEWFYARSMRSNVRCALPEIFSRAIKRMIAVLAGSPESAALIPSDFYKAVEADFLPFSNAKIRVHQMLGHAPASQEAMPVDSEMICLLRLATDNGVRMMFGDAGEAVFWIWPEDLVQRRFGAAWATLQGH